MPVNQTTTTGLIIIDEACNDLPIEAWNRQRKERPHEMDCTDDLLQANGAATQHEIPTPPYVRDQVTCATYMKAIAKDYNSYHGLSVDSARCMEYRS
jgi:hypothetical protein